MGRSDLDSSTNQSFLSYPAYKYLFSPTLSIIASSPWPPKGLKFLEKNQINLFFELKDKKN